MAKRDIKKELAELYLPPAKRVVEIDVPPMRFLMIDGQGDPNTSAEYAEAVEALFAVSYSVRFAAKRGVLDIDYGVMPLEGLWWADDPAVFASGDRAAWRWTMMIMQPDFVSAEMIEHAVAEVARKKGLPGVDRMRFEAFAEGLCAQTLHVGPFSAEGPTIDAVHAFITDSGRELTGPHHEIYLTDIRRADPAKWKTVIRQPMR